MHLYVPKWGPLALGRCVVPPCTSAGCKCYSHLPVRRNLSWVSSPWPGERATLHYLLFAHQCRKEQHHVRWDKHFNLHFDFLAWYSAGKFFVPCDTWHNNGLKQIKTMNRSYLKGHIYKQGGCAKLGIFLNPSVHAICTSKSTMPPCYRQRLWFMYRSLKIAFTSWTPFYNCSSTQAQAEVNFHTISAVIKTICV